MTFRNIVTNQGEFNPADYDIDRITRIITASVLGDGGLCIGKGMKNARYNTAKVIGHLDYVDWLRNVVELITPTKTYNRSSKPYNIYGIIGVSKGYDALQSKSHQLFTEIHEACYKNRKKVVPETLELDAETVAMLLMDDGTRHNGDGYVKICVNGFDLASVEILHEQFVEVTGLSWVIAKATALKNGDQAYELRLPRRHVEKLAIMLKPYTFPSFYYKLGLEPDGVTPIPLKMRSI
jgi:hypothetical protein